MKIILTLIIVFIVVTLGVFLFLKGYFQKRRMDNRMKDFLQSPLAIEIVKEEMKLSIFKRLFLKVSTIFENLQFSETTKRLLVESGSGLKPAEFLALRMFTSAGITILSAFLGISWYLLIPAFLIGFMIPKKMVQRKRKKRLERINYQLIEVLGMMANSMRAGFSFMQAMQLVGKEIPDPLGPEFERVVRQTGLGIPIEDVFEELVERLPNNELEVAVRAILAQRKSGGNLAQLLETMEDTIRGRIRILEELRTLTAQGRLSTWIITLLPVALAFYLALVNWDYFAPMVQEPLGWVLIFAGAAANVIGWLFIRKIIRIEV